MKYTIFPYEATPFARTPQITPHDRARHPIISHLRIVDSQVRLHNKIKPNQNLPHFPPVRPRADISIDMSVFNIHSKDFVVPMFFTSWGSEGHINEGQRWMGHIVTETRILWIETHIIRFTEVTSIDTLFLKKCLIDAFTVSCFFNAVTMVPEITIQLIPFLHNLWPRLHQDCYLFHLF